MARAKNPTRAARERRHARVRKAVSGSPERARLNVYRSLSHIYAQVIDDSAGRTLAAASSLTVKGQRTKTEQAREVGKAVAEAARQAGVTRVVFDRGGYQYHGRIKALAEGARDGGLEF